MTLSAFHTHTTFCDGKNTAEEMILRAVELGCPEIGFTSHSYMGHDNRWCMSRETTELYKKEILRLKDKYFGRIKVFLGIEYDYFSDFNTSDYDYVLGSVHYVFKNGYYIPVDETAKHHKDAIKELYGGVSNALAEDYYKTLGDIYNKTGCNIVGHFDIITKFNEKEKIYDTDSPRYRKAAISALDTLEKCPVTFEINTGAISRGYRTTPYPEGFILDEMGKRGVGLVITSDTHRADTLLFGMNDVENTLKSKGFRYFTSMSEILKK